MPERDTLGARQPLDLGVAVERQFDRLRVDLDPFAAEQHEAVGRGEKVRYFRGRQRLAVEGDGDVEIQHLARADEGGSFGADGRLDPWPAGPGVGPAGGHSQDEARRLQRRRVAEQARRLHRGPAERVENLAALDDFLEPAAGFARTVHRLQQFEQFRLGARVGIFAQRCAEWGVTQRAVRGDAGNVGRQKRERALRVLAVLREIEMHAPDMTPAAVACGEEGVEIEAAGRKLRLKGLRKFAPKRGERGGVEIFAAAHRRRVFGEAGEVAIRHGRAVGATARGEETQRESAPEGDVGRRCPARLGESEPQQSRPRAPRESRLKGAGKAVVAPWLALALFEAERAVRRQGGDERARHRISLHAGRSRRRRQAEDSQDGAVEPDDILVVQPFNLLAKFRLGNCGDLIHHRFGGDKQIIALAGL